MTSTLPASFCNDDSQTVTAPNGGLVHRDSLEHSDRFETKLWTVRDGVWCFVGNGLSNQVFIEAPDGLIAIDTGECVEEMQLALDAVSEHTDRDVIAVIYSHFHYVGGTRAVFDRVGAAVPIWSHAAVHANRLRATGEIGPAYRNGLVHQFGLALPAEGPDALVNVGLGMSFRNPAHAPYTDGYVEPTELFDQHTKVNIGGLNVELTPAPSDADDSITIWFPELSTCVNNIVWPVLFNVFPIRGEEYRDPRVLLSGLDHVIGLDAEYLVGVHGPPLSGAQAIRDEVTRSRDAIQFLWDQTVRGINQGLTLSELTELVQLPEMDGQTFRQRQLYGLVEHHVRQIHAGLRGWFDGDEAALFPVPEPERADRLIAGFGGVDEVRRQVADALEADDVRWAIELASWLQRSSTAADADRALLAEGLRKVARRTTSANVRNWCLTRARHLDGTADTTRYLRHRFVADQVANSPVADYLAILRVMLDPERCGSANGHLAVEADGDRGGLHVRNGVAVPTSGDEADMVLSLSKAQWGALFAGKARLADLADDDAVSMSDRARVVEFLSWFDHPSLSA